jgi:4'-phosphopantetheinyl transferase
MLTQPSNVVPVFWLATDRIRRNEWTGLRAMLNEAEQDQATRFHFAEDSAAYVAAHALLRGLLAPRLGCAPSEIRFVYGENGKPCLAATERGLHFNLSHTRGMVGVALALCRDIGIDVERVDRRRLTLDMARRFFAPAEVEQIYALLPERRCDASFAFWTLKEAYIKAVGVGLAMPLDGFAFTLTPLSLTFAQGIADDPSCWRFHCMSTAPDFVLAIAVRQNGPERVLFEVREADITALLALRL